MIWIRIDDHRIRVAEIIRYGIAIGADLKLKTEIELSSGSVIFVTQPPEDFDEFFRKENGGDAS